MWGGYAAVIDLYITCSGYAVYIFDFTHQHLMAVGGQGSHTFFLLGFERGRSVTTWGVARMSWRRYVFLHRIHPPSILIGIFPVQR